MGNALPAVTAGTQQFCFNAFYLSPCGIYRLCRSQHADLRICIRDDDDVTEHNDVNSMLRSFLMMTLASGSTYTFVKIRN